MDAMNKFKWAKKEGLSFNKLVLSLPVNVRCSKTDNAEWSIQGMTALPPHVERPYKAEPLVCGASSSSSVHRNRSLELLVGFVVLGSMLHSTRLWSSFCAWGRRFLWSTRVGLKTLWAWRVSTRPVENVRSHTPCLPTSILPCLPERCPLGSLLLLRYVR